MKAKQRFDSVKIKAHFDDNGFLVDRPIVARIGAQVYKTPHGDRVEFRPASEVFKQESLQSFAGKPITVGHVTVTPQNAKDVVVGSCAGAGIASGVGVEVPLSIYSDYAISKAKAKEAGELSVGYTSVDIDKPGWGSNETGEYIFEEDMKQDEAPPEGWVKFDAVQTNIKVNHIALVFKGRAGISKLNLDAEQEFPYDNNGQLTNEDKQMKKIKIDSVDVEVTEEVASHIEKLTAQIATIQGKADGFEAERDALKVRVDSLPELVKAEVEKQKADTAARAEVTAVAETAGVKHDGLDIKDVKIAVVKAMLDKDVSEKSDAYIDAMFDVAKDSDIMAIQRKAVKGDSIEGGKPEEKNDAAPVTPNSRLSKVM